MQKVKVSICGRSYTLSTEESEEYVTRLAARLDARINRFMDENPGASLLSAAVMTALELSDELYPGIFLTPGQQGPEVSALQRNLIRAAELNTFVPAVTVTGVYDDATEAAVRAVQADAGLDVNGITGPLTWDAVVRLGQPAA